MNVDEHGREKLLQGEEGFEKESRNSSLKSQNAPATFGH